MAARKGISASAFMASFSSAGRVTAPKACVNCKTQPERADSIYCSDACRRKFLSFEDPTVCLNCKTQDARPDSIYCSEPCREAFLTFPETKENN